MEFFVCFLLIVSNTAWLWMMLVQTRRLSDVQAERADLQRQYDRLRARQIEALNAKEQIAVNN